MRAIMTMAMVAAGLLLAACNTVKGVGEDVSSAGDAVAGAAEKAKK
jgi:predicted small secreted protein